MKKKHSNKGRKWTAVQRANYTATIAKRRGTVLPAARARKQLKGTEIVPTEVILPRRITSPVPQPIRDTDAIVARFNRLPQAGRIFLLEELKKLTYTG